MKLKALISTLAVIAASVLPIGVMGADQPETGTISGQLNIGTNTPMAGATVFVYNVSTGPPPSSERYWRVPDHSDPVDSGGRFSVNVPAGEYYVGAIKRRNSSHIGPPLTGDLFVIDVDERKMPKKHAVAKGGKKDIGTITGAAQLDQVFSGPGLTAVEGKVTDIDGKPLEGISVFAFATPTVAGKPLFVSNMSDKDGRFILRVNEGGTFYLKVRDGYGGGPPRSGAVLDGGKAVPLLEVSVRSGEIIRGIELSGRKFPGRGPTKE